MRMREGQDRRTAARLRRVRGSKSEYTVDALERELRRSRRTERSRRDRRDRLVVLIIALAVAAVATMQFITFVQLRGNGMQPTLEAGSVVGCLREGTPLAPKNIQKGELVLMNHQGNILIRRVIALGGDEVDVDPDGTLFVNGQRQDGAAGGGDLVYPIKVPSNEMFVLGDYRALAIDSRSRDFGTVPTNAVIGRPRAVIWPAYKLAWLGEDAAG